MSTLRELTANFSTTGRLEKIILRPARNQPANFVAQTCAEPGRGIIGDRYANRESTKPGRREITLIQAEHLPLLASWLNRNELDARLLRRNLVVSGINLLSLRSPFPDRKVICQIGNELQIEITGPCDPCSKMERELVIGTYNIMRGHGGVTAQVLRAGKINIGDEVVALAAPTPQLIHSR